MNDYFSDICDWRDGDDWEPQTYLTVEDSVVIDGIQYDYTYVERDWYVLGKSKAENLAMGHCHVITVNSPMPCKNPKLRFCSVVCGDSFEQAMKHLRQLHDHYMFLKDMTEEQFREYLDSNKKDRGSL